MDERGGLDDDLEGNTNLGGGFNRLSIEDFLTRFSDNVEHIKLFTVFFEIEEGVLFLLKSNFLFSDFDFCFLY